MPPIDFTVVAAFAILWAAIVPTPGANSLMVTHIALTRGPSHIAQAIAGNMAGISLLALCALFGMAILLNAFPWLRFAVHLFGGAYLIYFGALLLRKSQRPGPTEETVEKSEPRKHQAWRTFGLGFATALSNAQAIVFITSIFAVTGILQANLATGLACILVMILMNSAYLGFLGWIFLLPTPRRLYLRFRRWIEATIGVLFTFFGLRLILRELARS